MKGKSYIRKATILLLCLTVIYAISTFFAFLSCASRIDTFTADCDKQTSGIDSSLKECNNHCIKLEDQILFHSQKRGVYSEEQKTLLEDLEKANEKDSALRLAVVIHEAIFRSLQSSGSTDIKQLSCQQNECFVAKKQRSRNCIRIKELKNGSEDLSNHISKCDSLTEVLSSEIQLHKDTINALEVEKSDFTNEFELDRQLLHRTYLFAIVLVSMLLSFPIVYYQWVKAIINVKRDMKIMSRKKMRHYFSSPLKFTRRFRHKILVDLRSYLGLFYQNLKSTIFKLIVVIAFALAMGLLFVYSTDYDVESVFVKFLIIALIVLLGILAASLIVENFIIRATFALKLMFGLEVFFKNVKDNKSYCLYLRNFSSETPEVEKFTQLPVKSQITSLKEKVLDFFSEIEDTSLDVEEEELTMQLLLDTKFNSIFFSYIQKYLPVFYLANIKDRHPPRELIPIYSEGEDWLVSVEEIIDNAALVVVYISKPSKGIREELNYISRNYYHSKCIIILQDITQLEHLKKKLPVLTGFSNLFDKRDLLNECLNNEEFLADALNLDVILHSAKRFAI